MLKELYMDIIITQTEISHFITFVVLVIILVLFKSIKDHELVTELEDSIKKLKNEKQELIETIKHKDREIHTAKVRIDNLVDYRGTVTEKLNTLLTMNAELQQQLLHTRSKE